MEVSNIDFNKFRTEVCEEIRDHGKLGEFSGALGEKPAAELFNVIFDILEFFVVSSPFGGLITYVCEQARHAVLFKSVEGVTMDDELGELIRSVWGAEINSRASRKKLLRNIARLPNVKFLRIILAGHFVTRVYWTQWEKEDRLILLEAAEEVLRPIALHLDKGALKRIIDDDLDTADDGDVGKGVRPN